MVSVMLGILVSSFPSLTHLLRTLASRIYICHSQFTNGETEAQRIQ